MVQRPDDASARMENSGQVAKLVMAQHIDKVEFGSDSVPIEPARELPSDALEFIDHKPALAWLDAQAARDADGPAARALVVTGTAGGGKTSLAVHWSHKAAADYPDGQLYINLRGYDVGEPVGAAEALDRLLRSLGVAPSAVPPGLDARSALFRSRVADRRVLVLLDNAASADQVGPLLPGSPACLVVVTSRSMLAGLGSGTAAVRRLRLGLLDEGDAAALVASVADGHDGLDDSAAPGELVRLCARLPLALRVAAERLALRPHARLADIAAELRDESRLWDALSVEEGREADDVRAVFAWSYRALTREAGRMFRLLGSHPGPLITVESAAALAGTTAAQAERILTGLVGKHLVEAPRHNAYEFHDLLRAFARYQSRTEDTDAERSQAVERLAVWLKHAAKAASVATGNDSLALEVGPVPPDCPVPAFPDHATARSWFLSQRENIAATVRTAAELGMDGLAWEIPAVLHGLHATDNTFEDWIASAEIGLEAARRLTNRRAEAILLESLGKANAQRSQLTEADRLQNESLTIRRELGDPVGQTRSLNALGIVRWRQHRLPEALTYYRAALDLTEQTGDTTMASYAMLNIGQVLADGGDCQEAESWLRRALAEHRDHERPIAVSDTLQALAKTLRGLGRTAEAVACAEEAVAVADRIGSAQYAGYALLEAGHAYLAAGEVEAAFEAFSRSTAIHVRIGDRLREAKSYSGAAEVYSAGGRKVDAAQFHRTAARLYAEVGDLAGQHAELHRAAVADDATS
ncbi:ATP-binding protein [Catenulispora rubra]|uniref:ATP-binding protein n=1 Tax=Catenulispora rubra TaxID=280293 RepID=UPI00189226E5|nr:tetratricopeptide repeat protein [Catenulispora rubra]